MNTLSINPDRLFSKLDALSKIGTTPQGGVRRLALTDEDKLGRDLVVSWMRELNLQIKIDQIGNIFATQPSKEGRYDQPVMTGSHIDTVINGGNLDGNLGVVAGIEAINRLDELNIQTKRPLSVGVFTNEEGARFQPDMMGSLVYVGGLDLQTALASIDKQGCVLGDELNRIGYAGEMTCGELKPYAFLELHIEQGPILEQESITIGVVENLQGISWQEITVNGQANHAGTTPMHLRKDAGYCAAKIAQFVVELANEIGHGQVATVETMQFKPNVINVVPSQVTLTVDLRNPDNQLLTKSERALNRFVTELTKQSDISIEFRQLARFDPVIFDQSICRSIERHSSNLNATHRRMTSGAGHDAQMMARICPTAMIFIPSIGGVSHNPAEATDRNDVICGSNVLLNSLIDLANQ